MNKFKYDISDIAAFFADNRPIQTIAILFQCAGNAHEFCPHFKQGVLSKGETYRIELQNTGNPQTDLSLELKDAPDSCQNDEQEAPLHRHLVATDLQAVQILAGHLKATRAPLNQ